MFGSRHGLWLLLLTLPLLLQACVGTPLSRDAQDFRPRPSPPEEAPELVVARFLQQLQDDSLTPESIRATIDVLAFRALVDPSLLKGLTDQQAEARLSEAFYSLCLHDGALRVALLGWTPSSRLAIPMGDADARRYTLLKPGEGGISLEMDVYLSHSLQGWRITGFSGARPAGDGPPR